MHASASARKPMRRAYIPSFRDLYSLDERQNPYAHHPRAVTLLHHLVARATIWETPTRERGSIALSRRKLAELSGMSEKHVRCALAKLECEGAIACVSRRRGNQPAVYVIVGFESWCPLGGPTKGPQIPAPSDGTGWGISRSTRQWGQQRAHKPDSVPHIEVKEEKNLTTTTDVARAMAASGGGGEGVAALAFPSGEGSRPQEDWQGLAELDAAATSPAPQTPPAVAPPAIGAQPVSAPLDDGRAGSRQRFDGKPETPTDAADAPRSSLGGSEGTFDVQALARLFNAVAGPGVHRAPPELLQRSQGEDGPLAVACRTNPDPAYWQALFETVAASPWLQGAQGKKIPTTLAWVADPRNATKILSGDFIDREKIRDTALVEYAATKEAKEREEAEALSAKKAADAAERHRVAVERQDAEQRKWRGRAEKGRIVLPWKELFRRPDGDDS